MEQRTDVLIQWKSDQGRYWGEGRGGVLFHVTEEAFLICVHEQLLAQGVTGTPTLALVIDAFVSCRRVDFWLQCARGPYDAPRHIVLSIPLSTYIHSDLTWIDR